MSTYTHPRYWIDVLKIYNENVLKITQILEITVIITDDYEDDHIIFLISCPDEKITILTQKLKEDIKDVIIRRESESYLKSD